MCLRINSYQIPKEKAEDLGLEISFLSCGAENIPLPDNHIDTAVNLYTMCTIPEVLNDSGFDIIEIEEMYLQNTPKFVGYN